LPKPTALFLPAIVVELSQDSIHRHYAWTLLAEIERTLAENEDDPSRQSRGTPSRMHRVLPPLQRGHGFQSTIQLALVHMYRGRLEDAENEVKQLEKQTDRGSRWRAMTLFLRSRIKGRQNDFTGARELAREALIIAESGPFESVAIDAHLSHIRSSRL